MLFKRELATRLKMGIQICQVMEHAHQSGEAVDCSMEKIYITQEDQRVHVSLARREPLTLDTPPFLPAPEIVLSPFEGREVFHSPAHNLWSFGDVLWILKMRKISWLKGFELTFPGKPEGLSIEEQYASFLRRVNWMECSVRYIFERSENPVERVMEGFFLSIRLFDPHSKKCDMS